MIIIVNYGVGNVASIQNMLRHIGVESAISDDPASLETAQGIILPGVGSFDFGMTQIESGGWRSILDEQVLHAQKPILGICLGMQMMAQSSDEGTREGLGWIDTRVMRLQPEQPGLKVPHMGWNYITPQTASPLFPDSAEENRFYFVHSYAIQNQALSSCAATTNYGGSFVSAVARGNIHGVQFHPEKSHKYGMRLLQRFSRHVESLQPASAQADA